jgi:hypothetical protein
MLRARSPSVYRNSGSVPIQMARGRSKSASRGANSGQFISSEEFIAKKFGGPGPGARMRSQSNVRYVPVMPQQQQQRGSRSKSRSGQRQQQQPRRQNQQPRQQAVPIVNTYFSIEGGLDGTVKKAAKMSKNINIKSNVPLRQDVFRSAEGIRVFMLWPSAEISKLEGQVITAMDAAGFDLLRGSDPSAALKGLGGVTDAIKLKNDQEIAYDDLFT